MRTDSEDKVGFFPSVGPMQEPELKNENQEHSQVTACAMEGSTLWLGNRGQQLKSLSHSERARSTKMQTL